jgi:hypothetical protein
MNEIEPSLAKIHAYWKDKRVSQPGGVVQHEYRLGGQKGGCAGSSWRAKGRPQRSVSLWQWQEIQEVLRRQRRSGRFALRSLR